MPPQHNRAPLALAIVVAALLLAPAGTVIRGAPTSKVTAIPPETTCGARLGASSECPTLLASSVEGMAAVTGPGFPRPATSAPSLAWSNRTTAMGVGPTTLFGSLAFDPDLGSFGGEFVYFGGCLLPPSSCPTNVTWLYDGISWSPSSSAKLPPPLSGAMMDFDPTLGGAVLVGGMGAAGSALNETWLYTNSGWSNLSATAWGRNAPHSAFGTVAWDPVRNGIVLVDGCSGKPACASYADGTWLLNSTGWHLVGNGPGSPAAIAHATMSWDAADRILVLFGGNDSGRRLLNETWIYNGSAWTNATGVVPGCTLQCYYPTARESSLLTWDAQLGMLVMFGGRNTSSARIYNDTWSFNRASGWSQLDQLAGLVDPIANSDGSLAENSSGTAPLLVSGGCTTSAPAGCLGDEWSLETAPTPVVSALGPLPADAGVPISIRIEVSQATGAGPEAAWLITFGDGGFASGHAIRLQAGAGSWNYSATHVYSTGGAYNLSYSVTDFFSVSSGGSAPVMIGPPLSLNGTGTPGTTIAGYPVQFSAVAFGGTPPYRYLWAFGDGGSAPGANATHSYNTSGPFRAIATVSDGGRGSALSGVTIMVGPQLVGSAQAGWNPVDALAPDHFTATASGGMGAPYSFRWAFGDGGVGAGAATNYTYRNPGTQTVTLETMDRQGYTANGTLILVVNGALGATATASANSTFVGQPVMFDATPSSGSAPYTFAWVFGDGAGSRSAAPTHNYSQPAAYTVSVWVNDSGGGSVVDRLTVVVTNPGNCPGSTCGGPAGGTPPSAPFELIGGIVAAIVVGIALSWWYFRRPRSPDPARPPDGRSPSRSVLPPDPTNASGTPPTGNS